MGAVSLKNKIRLRTTWNLPEAPTNAVAVISADNRYDLKINGKKVLTDGNWENVEAAHLHTHLRKGANEVEIVATNEGDGPNPAGAFFEARARLPDGTVAALATGTDWQWAEKDGKTWAPAAAASGPWAAQLNAGAAKLLANPQVENPAPVRASLLKSDLLMRSLGRPNREQIVSARPNDLTTLEAIDLANGPSLYEMVVRGARNLLEQSWTGPEAFTDHLFRHALSRAPTGAERAAIAEVLGAKLEPRGVEDALWMVVLHPEFQYVR